MTIEGSHKVCGSCKKDMPIDRFEVKKVFMGIPQYYTQCIECRRKAKLTRNEIEKIKKQEMRDRMKAEGKSTATYEKKYDPVFLESISAANKAKVEKIREKLDLYHKGTAYENQILDLVTSIERTTAIMVADHISRNGYESLSTIYEKYIGGSK